VLLECGGKSAVVVLEDAGDLDAVAEHSAFAAFWNMGENCTANSRLLVHRSLREPLLERILQKAGEWIVGDPMDESTRVGALIEPAHMQKVLGHISGASEEGAKLVH